MTKRTWPSDPAQPGFPHGTLYGYRLGCRRSVHTCPADPGCPDVWNRHTKHAKARKAGVVASRGTERVPAGPVLDRIRELRTTAGVSCATIARAAGIPSNTVSDIAARRPATVYQRVANAILRVGHVDVAREAARLPSGRYIQLCRSMQAQGWTLRWQLDQLGVRGNNLTFFYRPNISRDLAGRIHALACSVEGRWGPSRHAMAAAARSGHHPLACYDDDGTLIPSAVRGDLEERRARREARAATRLEALRLSLPPHSLPADGIAARLRVNRRTVDRYRSDVGLHLNWVEADGRTEVRPESLHQAETVAAAVAAYSAEEIDAVDALTAIRTRPGTAAAHAKVA